MNYTYDIQTTDGPYNPDEWASVGVGPGMSCASSTVWIRVTRGDQSTPWTECLGCPSIIKARNLFDVTLATYGDVDEDVAAAWLAVTRVPLILSPPQPGGPTII